MSPPEPTTLPPPQVCEQARLSRDPRFDGLFFTAVTSTRIYCRPVCPAPWAKRVSYYGTAAAAEAAGYRPCLRCRPELSPSDGAWRRGDAAVARALKLIDQGVLAEQPLSALAERVNLGERQLRRLFVERLGAPPIGVHGTRRLLFAKQLLTETTLPITDVALAAGFGSLRRFNASFKEAYRMAPRDLRRRPAVADVEHGETLTLRLGYRPPYDFDSMLAFLRGRALPGVENVDEHSYARSIPGDGTHATPGWLRVSAWRGGEHALKLELHAPLAARLLDIVNRLRRMFDLDADPHAIAVALSTDERLRPLLHKRPGLRLPSGWDGFEIAVRAILGQQVSVAAARTFAARIAQRFGTPLADEHAAHGLTHLFPAAEALADADLAGPAGIGITRPRAETVRGIARALLDGRVDFRVEHTLEEFVAAWTALPGIGPWTAHYIALRALGHPDAFPAEDLVLQKAVPTDGTRMSAKALTARAEAWRPWRAYATLQLWRDAMAAPAAALLQGIGSREGGPMTLLSTHIPSPVGPLLLVAGDSHLRAIWFSTPRHPLPRDIVMKQGENDVIRETRAQLDAYFAGARRTFDLPLQPVGTPFQREVWTMLTRIPYGETWSYGDLARRIGKPAAVRAVGAANGRNPIPIVVPCHRVIGADGSLTGFGGGLPTKQFLLTLEGALPSADLFG